MRYTVYVRCENEFSYINTVADEIENDLDAERIRAHAESCLRFVGLETEFTAYTQEG